MITSMITSNRIKTPPSWHYLRQLSTFLNVAHLRAIILNIDKQTQMFVYVTFFCMKYVMLSLSLTSARCVYIRTVLRLKCEVLKSLQEATSRKSRLVRQQDLHIQEEVPRPSTHSMVVAAGSSATGSTGRLRAGNPPAKPKKANKKHYF